MMNQFFASIGGQNQTGIVESNEIDYHFVSGQSNAAGRIDHAALIDDLSYLSGPMIISGHTAFIRNQALNPENFNVMEAGVNTSDALEKLGIQPELAYRMLNHKQADFRIIQSAFGGTTIGAYSYGSENWIWMMNAAKEARYSANQLGKKARFKSVTWIQGESDGGDNTGIYEAALKKLANDFRTYLQEPELQFIIIQMIDCQTGVNNLELLQEAQYNASIYTNNHLISKNDGVNTCRDVLHFSDEKYLSVSNLVFQIIKDL